MSVEELLSDREGRRREGGDSATLLSEQTVDLQIKSACSGAQGRRVRNASEMLSVAFLIVESSGFPNSQ